VARALHRDTGRWVSSFGRDGGSALTPATPRPPAPCLAFGPSRVGGQVHFKRYRAGKGETRSFY
jgi:hypothetical protein